MAGESPVTTNIRPPGLTQPLNCSVNLGHRSGHHHDVVSLLGLPATHHVAFEQFNVA